MSDAVTPGDAAGAAQESGMSVRLLPFRDYLQLTPD